MKKTLHLFLLTIIYLICGAKSCNNADSTLNSANKSISASRDSIIKAIEIDIPDSELLEMYEQNAKQKLNDFIDYMKIVSDTTKDFLFRQRAAEMARKLFINDEINVRNWDDDSEIAKNHTLNQLLNKNLQPGTSYWTDPEAIEIEKPLSQINDSVFRGQLSVIKKHLSLNKQLIIEKPKEKNFVDFYLLRRSKSFGNENVKVWEVLLGDIN
ncbi:MAG: hypothetical protein ACOYOV_15850 [Bacteroidales bacterium]